MGTTYCGPFAEQIDLGGHEGYVARILPDGTETGTWTWGSREFTGYRARCECGWRGTTAYPPTDEGRDLADEEWDRDHLAPLIDVEARRHSVPAVVLLDLVRGLRAAVWDAEQGREVLTERSRGVLDVVERVEQLLDESAGE